MRNVARWGFVIFCAMALLIPAIAAADIQQELELPPLGRCVYTCGDGTTGAGTVIASGCSVLCDWNCANNGGCSSFGWAKLRNQAATGQ